ncbi:MAG TPA: NHLP leader peptide family RiPP precursor [Candidatus Baltobacteraceae bacterium]|nr:NHLP leader peptide family RiPP precursor [Candidatus Baltobacteraceae bacterium]
MQGSLYSKIIAKAWADEAFKRRLLEHPLETLRAEGAVVPDGVRVTVVENTPEAVTFVLPRKSADELSEHQLASATGGILTDGY